MAVLIGAFSLRVSPGLVMRFGARATLLPGLVLIVVGLALFARAPVDAAYVVDVLPVMVLLGVGAGLVFPALMTLAMSGATRSDSGLASGLVNTTQQVGGALGLAVLATLSTTRTDTLLAEGESTASALTDGYHLAFTVGSRPGGVRHPARRDRAQAGRGRRGGGLRGGGRGRTDAQPAYSEAA